MGKIGCLAAIKENIKKVEGEELEHCRILGIPKLLIREIED